MRSVFSSITLITVTFALPVTVRGQWQVVYLHPDGADSSVVYAAAGAQQGGRLEPEDILSYRPIIWNGSSDDYVDLLPDGARNGILNGMDTSWQVGTVYFDYSNPRAALWSGTPESFVDLTPGGDYGSCGALAVAAGQQVGYATYTPTAMHHAALWYGSAASFVDLHPSVGRSSSASATDGACQGGWVDRIEPGVGIHAALWAGGAQSFIDMNPPGAHESAILGMANDLQVGWGLLGGRDHALLWRGSAETCVDMHPSEGYSSRLYETTGTMHVGYTNYTGWAEAGIWTDEDPDSFENLHAYLGPQWYVSAAYAVSTHAGWLYVAGSAVRTAGQQEAILWKRRLSGSEGSATLIMAERILPRP